jgi:hypothetical protein
MNLYFQRINKVALIGADISISGFLSHSRSRSRSRSLTHTHTHTHTQNSFIISFALKVLTPFKLNRNLFERVRNKLGLNKESDQSSSASRRGRFVSSHSSSSIMYILIDVVVWRRMNSVFTIVQEAIEDVVEEANNKKALHCRNVKSILISVNSKRF